MCPSVPLRSAPMLRPVPKCSTGSIIDSSAGLTVDSTVDSTAGSTVEFTVESIVGSIVESTIVPP